MNMTVHIKQASDRVSIDFAGELDLATHQQTRDALRWALGRPTTAIEVNLDRVRLLDCSTLAIFLAVHREAARRGVVLAVSNPHGLVRRLLQVTDTLALLTGHFERPSPGSPRTDGKRPAMRPSSRRPPSHPALRRPGAAGHGRLDDA